MKKFSKIKLKNVTNYLTNKEMKNISGGYMYDRRWRCVCTGSGGVNPPFRSPWESFYHLEEQMAKDIETICASKEATCSVLF